MAITAKIKGFRGSTVPQTQQRILQRDVELAYAMATSVQLEIDLVWHQAGPDKRGKRQRVWLDNPRIVRFFGTGVLTNPQFKEVHNKVKKIQDILFSGKLVLTVKPRQDQCDGQTTDASSGGRWMVDKRIFICQLYFQSTAQERAAILVHELVHKIGGHAVAGAAIGLVGGPPGVAAGAAIGAMVPTGHKTSQESQVMAQVEALAKNTPRKARNNPDSYELLYQQYFHRVDAAVHRVSNGKWYLFCGNRHVRFTPGGGPKADAGYPVPITAWGRLPKEFRRGIDAALYRHDNQALYFFKGNRYVRFDKGSNTVNREYPKFLSEWKGMPARFQEGIDCALWRGDNKRIYFFKGDEYLRFSSVAHGMDNGFPKRIASSPEWSWLPVDFRFGLGAALWDDDQKRIYFFKGNQYVRSSDHKKVDGGYPRPILRNWIGVPVATPIFDPEGQPAGVFKLRD